MSLRYSYTRGLTWLFSFSIQFIVITSLNVIILDYRSKQIQNHDLWFHIGDWYIVQDFWFQIDSKIRKKIFDIICISNLRQFYLNKTNYSYFELLFYLWCPQNKEHIVIKYFSSLFVNIYLKCSIFTRSKCWKVNWPWNRIN